MFVFSFFIFYFSTTTFCDLPFIWFSRDMVLTLVQQASLLYQKCTKTNISISQEVFSFKDYVQLSVTFLFEEITSVLKRKF